MPTAFSSLDELIAATLAKQSHNDLIADRVTVAFSTRQGAKHDARQTHYRNHVVSLRLHESVGSCAVEPDALDDETVHACVGRTIAELLDHPNRAIQIAALDAFLTHIRPHETHGKPVVVPGGSSREKSLARAVSVLTLLPTRKNDVVLVIGVVNSLLHLLREQGINYIPCDLKGGSTEWGDKIITDFTSVVDRCDSLLVSGMVLGNGAFEPLLAHARATQKPMAMFAQTGSGILPWFIGSGVTAVSAEPYPFFWLDGGKSTLYQYSSAFGR